MDTILLVCYSYTGTTRRVAELLASHHGWPLGQVSDAKPRAGGLGTLRCVLDALLHRHPPIRYEGPDPGDFRTVVLLAPVWMYGLAGPMRSFIVQHREALRRVAVICTMGSGGGSNALSHVARLLGHAPIASACFLQREVDDGSCTSRVLAFGQTLQPGGSAAQPARARRPAAETADPARA